MHDPASPNWIGLRTLYMREVLRFSKVYTQTILAPVVTTLLFLAIFSLVCCFFSLFGTAFTVGATFHHSTLRLEWICCLPTQVHLVYLYQLTP